jgi:hypothetical protein
MVDLNDGLVLYLPMSEGSGSKVRDRSKYGNHGTISGAVFLKPYENDTTDEGEAPLVLFDDGGVAFWTLVDGVESDDTTIKKYGTDSYKVALTVQTLHFYHDYGSNQDFTKYDFASFWFYGCNTGDSMDTTFYNEVWASRVNGYRFFFTDNFSGWKRFIVPLSRFSDVGTPTGWNNIRSLRFAGSNNQTCSYYLDRVIFDVGNWRHGEALDFDGNDYVTFGSQLIPVSAFTYTFWAKGSGASGTGGVGIWIGTVGGPAWIGYHKVNQLIGFGCVEGDTYASIGLPDQTNWHFIVATWDGSVLKLYLNGVFIQQWNKTFIPSGNTCLGETGGSNFLDGLIDEVRIYNRALSSEEIRTLYNEKAFDLDRGLVLNLPFEEGSGTKTFDRSKQQNNGTLINSPTWTVSGKIGNALNFDGTDDYLTVTESESLKGSELTWALWVKIDVKDRWHGLICHGAYPRLQIGDNNRISMAAIPDADGDAGTTLESNANIIDINQWYHIVVTYDSSYNLKLYLNGVLIKTVTGLGPLSFWRNLTWLLGAYTATPDNPLDGILDEVHIYRRALSAEEIRTLYLRTVR